MFSHSKSDFISDVLRHSWLFRRNDLGHFMYFLLPICFFSFFSWTCCSLFGTLDLFWRLFVIDQSFPVIMEYLNFSFFKTVIWTILLCVCSFMTFGSFYILQFIHSFKGINFKCGMLCVAELGETMVFSWTARMFCYSCRLQYLFILSKQPVKCSK